MFMAKSKVIVCAMLVMFLAGCARQTKQAPAGGEAASSTAKPIRVSAENTDAAEPSIARAPDGTIYVAWVEHRENNEADVMLAHVDDEGRSKGAPVRVNPKAGEATAWRGDPPTLAVAPDGTVYAGWTATLPAQKHATDLYLSTSRDGGRTFDPPLKVNDDGMAVGHGMHSLAVGTDGRVYVAWLDERNKARSAPAGGSMQKMDHMESNREVFVAFSADSGRSISKNQLVAKDACPCCKTAIAAGPDGRVFASWRQVLPGEFRHIAVAASDDGARSFSPRVIVSDDRWMIATCPVSGPALSIADDGALRVVWYTEGEKAAPGIYWVESKDNGRSFSPGRALANGEARGTPILLANRRSAPLVVWESNEGGSPRVMSAPLADAGTPTPTLLASVGELPSAAASADQIFVGYIARINDRRSIWIMRTRYPI
ncbi:MAG: hypothetical protein QOJ64_4419 [Acidobacteriota bacterium]|jgi:hypothetical protein|nr:hypothetical protein [Acidobacteriota bacterium]